MRKCLAYLLLLMAIFSLTACFKPVKTPPVKTYTLSAESLLQATRKSKGHGVLFVAPPSASPGYDTEAMIYTNTPYQLLHFSAHAWVAPPAQMLTPLLVADWQNTGCFRAVVGSASSGTADVTVNTQLLALQQEFDQNTSRVRMAIQITLIDNSSGEIAASRRYEAIVPAAPNPYGGVIAANRATREILNKTNHFICNYAKH